MAEETKAIRVDPSDPTCLAQGFQLIDDNITKLERAVSTLAQV